MVVVALLSVYLVESVDVVSVYLVVNCTTFDWIRWVLVTSRAAAWSTTNGSSLSFSFSWDVCVVATLPPSSVKFYFIQNLEIWNLYIFNSFPCTTVHIFFNTTLDARWDLRAPREPVGQNESNDTTPRSLYVGRNFTLYDVTVSR